MFKKVLLIFFLMFILLGNQAFVPSKDHSFINGSSILKIHQKTIVFAAETGQPSARKLDKAEITSWSYYIVPGAVGVVLIFSIGSYWLVFRKRQMKKEV
jgi:ABC-type multidrug transport system permease subunit